MKYIFLILTLIFLTGCSSNDNISNQNITEYTKLSTNTNSNSTTIHERVLGTANTEILDKASGRLNNIRITCNTINNYILKARETFSFNDIVGSASADKGYQEATVLDAEGNYIKGYGGGNCQVSSTLYNAVLNSNLEVVERYKHSNDVSYVEDGKDAAVSFSSKVDFKFKNNTAHDIKILASSNDKNVTISIVTSY